MIPINPPASPSLWVFVKAVFSNTLSLAAGSLAVLIGGAGVIYGWVAQFQYWSVILVAYFACAFVVWREERRQRINDHALLLPGQPKLFFEVEPFDSQNWNLLLLNLGETAILTSFSFQMPPDYRVYLDPYQPKLWHTGERKVLEVRFEKGPFNSSPLSPSFSDLLDEAFTGDWTQPRSMTLEFRDTLRRAYCLTCKCVYDPLTRIPRIEYEDQVPRVDNAAAAAA